MTAKPIIRLRSAHQDERDAIAYYAGEAGLDVALRLAEPLQDTYQSIGDQPRIGSPRYGDLLGIRGLRSRKLGRFPYLIFYAERDDRVEIWRVLHAQRDIPTELAE